MAARVLQIFHRAEPNQIPHILCSPCMKNACPEMAMEYLELIEKMAPSVLVTLVKGSVALKKGDRERCEKELESEAEVQIIGGYIYIHTNKNTYIHTYNYSTIEAYIFAVCFFKKIEKNGIRYHSKCRVESTS